MLTREKLREYLYYCASTGLFLRVKSGWSTRVGHVAGSFDSYGYLQIKVDGVLYLAHRLAWLWVYGIWPVREVDHVNGVRSDNRITNLRLATHTENMQNQFRAQRSNKSSGLLGAHYDARGPKGKKWRGSIFVSGRNINLGNFATPLAAHRAYLKAKRKHHPTATVAR